MKYLTREATTNNVTKRRVRATIVAELGHCYFSLLLKSIIFMCADPQFIQSEKEPSFFF